MRCVFCGATYSADTYICRTCNDYKGMEEISGEGPKTLAVALDSVFALMEEARQAFADEPCDECGEFHDEPDNTDNSIIEPESRN